MSCFRLVTLAFLLVLATSVSADESAPEWSKKTFNAPPDRVFAAALKSITAQHHEIKTKDEATMLITFHVGMTAWSAHGFQVREATGQRHLGARSNP